MTVPLKAFLILVAVVEIILELGGFVIALTAIPMLDPRLFFVGVSFMIGAWMLRTWLKATLRRFGVPFMSTDRRRKG